MDAQGEKARVRGDDKLAVHVPFEGESARAVGLVAVVHARVEGEKRALRAAPRQTRGRHAAALGVEAEAPRLPEHRPGDERQKQLGHQVLEHRARPARETAPAVEGELRPAERLPVADGHLAPGAGDVARQPRLGRHEVVVARRGHARRGVEADIEQPPLLVVHRPQVDLVGKIHDAAGQPVEAVGGEAVGRGDQARAEVAAVHGRDVGRLKRGQRAGVIPVVEVAAPAGQRFDRAHEPFDEIGGAVVRRKLQLHRGDGGGDGHADVRRRRAPGRALRRLDLHVVGRQPVVFPRTVLLEILPDRAGALAEKFPVGGVHIVARRTHPARHMGKARRGGPYDADGLPGGAGRENHERKPGRRREPEGGGVSAPRRVGLGGGRPLEHIPVAHGHAPHRKTRRAEAGVRVPRQQDEPCQKPGQRAADAAQYAAAAAEAGVPGGHEQPRERVPRRVAAEAHERDETGGAKPRNHQREHDGNERRRGYEAAPHAVIQPPAVDGGEAAPSAEQPRKILPVAACPAAQAAKPRKRVHGLGVGQLHVAHVRAAQIRALDGVVAQDGVFRDASVEAGQKGRRVDETLSGEAAAPEEVGEQLARRGAVGIGAALTGVQPRKIRGEGGVQLHRHTRVDDGVAPCHDAVFDDGRVRRMQRRADERPRRAGHEAGVAVEAEDIPRPQRGRVARKALQAAVPSLREAAQLQHRAALSLPRREPPRPLVPDGLACQKEKAAAVPGVQGVDRVLRRPQALLGGRGGILRRVGQVGQQREYEAVAAVAVGQAVFLEPPGEGGAGVVVGQERGHGADRPPLRAHAAAQRETGQAARLHKAQKRRVEQRTDKLRYGQQREYRDGPRAGENARQHRQHQREAGVRRDVARARAPVRGKQRLVQPVVQERLRLLARRRAVRLRPLLYAGAVQGACLTVHERVRVIAAQKLVDRVGALERVGQVKLGQRAQAREQLRRPVGAYVVLRKTEDDRRPERRAEKDCLGFRYGLVASGPCEELLHAFLGDRAGVRELPEQGDERRPVRAAAHRTGRPQRPQSERALPPDEVFVVGVPAGGGV